MRTDGMEVVGRVERKETRGGLSCLCAKAFIVLVCHKWALQSTNNNLEPGRWSGYNRNGAAA